MAAERGPLQKMLELPPGRGSCRTCPIVSVAAAFMGRVFAPLYAASPHLARVRMGRFQGANSGCEDEFAVQRSEVLAE